MLSRLRSSLWAKLLAANLLVVVSGVVTLILATAIVAPPLFDQLMAEVAGPRLRSLGHTMTPAAEAAMRQLTAEAFRETVAVSLGLAIAAALIAAIVVSVFVSGRIASTVGRMTLAARRVASGRYSERVPPGEPDELGRLADSFNEMAEALETDERRRLELIGNVAHELRTPIANLQGYLEGMADGVVEPSRETWDFVMSETSRLGRLVQDLQELSRAEAKQIPITLGPVGPAGLVEMAVGGLRAEFEEKAISLEVLVPASLPDVLADKVRAVQLLSNLLTNALRYSSPGGSVEVSALQQDGAILFRVRDTGIGIEQEHLPLLFDRFYRVDKARSRAAGGSGIGLTIARSLVHAMGGRIWAESPGPGKGATFSFTLPVAR